MSEPARACSGSDGVFIASILLSRPGIPAFIETHCVQRGLYEVGCPDKAVTLQPRFVAHATARNAARVLHGDDLARCTSCGAPFTASLLAANLARTHDFPGLASAGGIERLRLCPACRQREALIPEG